MKLYTVVVHNLQMCMKEYRCCLKFRRRDNYNQRKQSLGGYIGITPSVCLSLHVPCKRNSSQAAYWIFMKLYTFVVHYLQMCMKEYGCPKFKRGDNLTYTFTKRRGHVPCRAPDKLRICVFYAMKTSKNACIIRSEGTHYAYILLCKQIFQIRNVLVQSCT